MVRSFVPSFCTHTALVAERNFFIFNRNQAKPTKSDKAKARAAEHVYTVILVTELC